MANKSCYVNPHELMKVHGHFLGVLSLNRMALTVWDGDTKDYRWDQETGGNIILISLSLFLVYVHLFFSP